MSKKEFEILLKSVISLNEGLTQEAVSLALGYNEGYISQMLSREKVSEKFVNAMKLKYLQNANISNESIPISKLRSLPQQETHTPPVKEITSISLESLIQINLNQSEALKINARARLIDAENNKILIEAVNKENAFNLGSALQSDRLTTAILSFVAQVAAGKRFDNEGQALAAIRKLLQESRQPQGVVDIQTH